jgi:hypothetical protein
MPEPTLEAWAQIRHDYEHTARPLAHICAEHDITIPMMRYRMKRWEWKRRKPLIPRHAPPSVPAMPADVSPLPVRAANGGVGPGVGDHFGPDAASPPTPPAFADAPVGEQVAPSDPDPALIVPRLQGAVARVLPAIEATIARLAGGSHHPRDMEQAGRTLGALTRTLRELNALLAQHNARLDAADPYDDMPEDIDAFRENLARRIEAFMESRTDEECGLQDSAGKGQK